MKKNELTKLVKYILLTCLFLYIPLIFGKLLLVYPDMGYDTYNSYLPQYELIVNKLSSGNLSLMDFTYGMGTNVFGMQSFLFDPFSLIPISFGMLFGAKNIAYVIVYMQIIKSIIAGIGCYYYLGEFKFSMKSKILVAYIYAFSGYIIGAGQHYHFASAPVFIIFVLLFIEKSFKDKRFLIALAGSIALTCSWSVFFAFHIIIFSGIYIFIRAIQNIEKISFFGIIKKILPVVSVIFLGLMLSGIIFLPSLFQIVKVSGRTDSDNSILTKIIMAFSFITKNDLKMSFLRFFSENIQGTVNNWTGGQYHFGAPHYFFSIALVISIPQYIINSFRNSGVVLKDRVIKALIILLVIFTITNYFFGYLSNAFATTNWRFIYVLVPLFGITIADTFDKIFIEKRYNRFANYFVILISVISIALFYERGSGISSKITVITVFACLIILSIILDFVASYSGENKRVIKIAFILLSLCIAFNIFSDNVVTIYGGRIFLTKDQLLSTYHDKNISEIVSYLNNKEKSNFYRLEKDFNDATPLFTYSVIERYRSTSSYNSTLNKNTIEFVKQIGNQNVTPGAILQAYAAGSFEGIFDNLVTDNLGIKYLISRYNGYRSGWVLEKQFGNLFLYRNEDLDYAGLLYEKYITEEDYASLSIIEKKLFMADSIVVKGLNENVYQRSKIDYTNILNAVDYDNIVIQNSWIDSKLITGEIIGSSWHDGLFDIPINTNTNIDNQQNILKFCIKPKDTFDIKVIFDSGNGFSFDQRIDYSQTVYEEQDNQITVRIPSNAKAVRLIFTQTSFRIFDIGIFTIKKSYTNKDIILENPNFGGIVKGIIRTQKDSLLYIPIPYEEGWKAYIDDVQTEILQANFGFSAIEVKQGEHKVEFIYKTPWLVPGAVLSGISIIVLFVMWFLIKSRLKIIAKI